jgi:CDP-diacylglycerol--glycerol-3-phosphate 3-phosphatidyltransferase
LFVIGLDIVRHIFDFAKFGRDVAYHAWSSKLWGLSLALALVLLMGFGVGQPFVGVTVTLGLIAQIEGLLISVALPVWTHDVPTLIHALRIRKTPGEHAAGDGKQRPG